MRSVTVHDADPRQSEHLKKVTSQISCVILYILKLVVLVSRFHQQLYHISLLSAYCLPTIFFNRHHDIVDDVLSCDSDELVAALREQARGQIKKRLLFQKLDRMGDESLFDIHCHLDTEKDIARKKQNVRIINSISLDFCNNFYFERIYL